MPNFNESPEQARRAPELVLVEKHLALIAKRCLFWWRFLPASVRVWYDPDDMIAEAVLHVCKRSARYDPNKAKETTWVYCVTDNFCKSRLQHWKARMYADCETVEWDDDVARKMPAASIAELRESRDAVERLIEVATDRVRGFLEKMFEGGLITEVPAWELREAARRSGVTADDLIRVYRACVS